MGLLLLEPYWMSRSLEKRLSDVKRVTPLSVGVVGMDSEKLIGLVRKGFRPTYAADSMAAIT
jgi:hypothetical protein